MDALIILLTIVGGLGCLPLTLLVIAWASGWADLGRRFPAARPPTGRVKRWTSVQVGNPLGGYNGIVTVGVSPDGLYLGLAWPLAFAHPNVLIPWEEVEDLGVTEGWLASAHAFRLGGTTRILLDRRLAKGCEEFLRAVESPEDEGAVLQLSAKREEGVHCPYCHDALGAAAMRTCQHCGTAHHRECLDAHGGCAVLACTGAPPPRERERA